MLLLCNHFPPAVDGVGDYTYRLGAELARQGHAVHVLCRKQSSGIPLPASMTLHPVFDGWNAHSEDAVLALVERIRPDWLGLQYVPQGFLPTGLPFFLPRLLERIRRLGLRICITFHEVQVRQTGLRGYITGALQHRIAHAMCRQADACVTSIEFYAGLLGGLHSDIRLIPVGSNIEVPVLRSPERARMRQELFPDTPYIVGTFGQRDHSAMLDAVQQINASGMKTGLLICGKAQAHNHQLPNVRYTGYRPAAEIGTYLQCSDLFLLPDYAGPNGEGGTCTKSGSLAAAFAAGLPVAGVRGDMTNSLLRHGENIWLAPDGGTAAIERALRLLLSDDALRSRLQTGGRRLFEAHLSWQQIAVGYKAILQPHYRVEAFV